MSYIKKDNKLYRIVEQEVNIADLEFHREQEQQHLDQMVANLVILDAEIKEIKKL